MAGNESRPYESVAVQLVASISGLVKPREESLRRMTKHLGLLEPASHIG